MSARAPARPDAADRPARAGARSRHDDGRRHAGREVAELRAVGQAPAGTLRPERALVCARRCCSTVLSVVARVIGPKILGNATNLIFDGRHRQAAARGPDRSSRRRGGCARAGQRQLADMLSGDGPSCPGQGIDFTAARPDPAARAGALRRRVAVRVAAGATCSTASCSAPSPAAQRGRGQDQPAAAAATSTRSPRGELLSRVTNDIDNIQPDDAADAEPAAHLGADGRRRARR